MSLSYINATAAQAFGQNGIASIVTYFKDCRLVFLTDKKHFYEQFTAKFDGQNAQLSQEQSDACDLILGNDGNGGFWSGTDTTCFKNFSRSALAVQMFARVLDYTVMNQAESSLCGPISVVMDVARRRPDRYVQYVIDLATTRDAYLGVSGADDDGIHVHIRKSSNILKAKATEDDMQMVDYVAVAGLRNSECFLPYRSPLTSTMLQGASVDSSISAWMKEAGYQNVEVHKWSWSGSALASAVDLGLNRLKTHLSSLVAKLNSGWTVVCSMTGANLASISLGRSKDSWVTKTFMGHYVLLRNVKTYADGASFDLVSWGEETNDITHPEKKLTWKEILGTYRGYVCGKS